jgi:mono/diheme cytochrome c family protein
MKSKSLLVLVFLIILLAAVTIVFYIFSQDNFTEIQVSDQVLDTYKENCARCHGQAGEGFEDFPELTDNGLSIKELKAIVSEGQNAMPPFSNIREPLLTDLATYVSSL